MVFSWAGFVRLKMYGVRIYNHTAGGKYQVLSLTWNFCETGHPTDILGLTFKELSFIHTLVARLWGW